MNETRIIDVPIAEAQPGDWVTLYRPGSFAEPTRVRIEGASGILYAAGHIVLYPGDTAVRSIVVGNTVEREVPVQPIPTEIGAVFRAKRQGDRGPYLFRVERKHDGKLPPLRSISLGEEAWLPFEAIDPATVELGRLEFTTDKKEN